MAAFDICGHRGLNAYDHLLFKAILMKHGKLGGVRTYCFVIKKWYFLCFVSILNRLLCSYTFPLQEWNTTLSVSHIHFIVCQMKLDASCFFYSFDNVVFDCTFEFVFYKHKRSGTSSWNCLPKQ